MRPSSRRSSPLIARRASPITAKSRSRRVNSPTGEPSPDSIWAVTDSAVEVGTTGRTAAAISPARGISSGPAETTVTGVQDRMSVPLRSVTGRVKVLSSE